jgi:hypothetical protein
LLFLFVVAGGAGHKKTHDRFQPWVLVKVALASTSANGVATYDDDQQYDLSND